MTPDVNVLVAASRNDHPHHGVAIDWLQGAVNDASPQRTLKLQPMVVASFLRLVTHPRIFVNPTPTEQALGFVDALLASSGVEQPALGAEWPTFRRICANKALTANDLPDAWLAAAVIHQSDHLFSFDRDFRRLLSRAQFTLLSA